MTTNNNQNDSQKVQNKIQNTLKQEAVKRNKILSNRVRTQDDRDACKVKEYPTVKRYTEPAWFKQHNFVDLQLS